MSFQMLSEELCLTDILNVACSSEPAVPVMSCYIQLFAHEVLASALSVCCVLVSNVHVHCTHVTQRSVKLLFLVFRLLSVQNITM